ncbi:ASCH domain-containing protein [Patescibacteria group bacterium]|nr:ASCH domain-containing protein [Patescibacteria group bacterium]MBU1867990.1 ASCH domain-containing protein [Patescibacteria group bacterium]
MGIPQIIHPNTDLLDTNAPIKTLKFANKDLVQLILSGKKTCTWRLWDDKELTVGDKLTLINRTSGSEFARAKIISVVEKPMRLLTNKGRKGHEQFKDDAEMYTTYTNYYGKEVTPETLVKIVKFEVLAE